MIINIIKNLGKVKYLRKTATGNHYILNKIPRCDEVRFQRNLLMTFFHGPGDIHHGKEHKHQRLHKRCKNHQNEYGKWNKIGNQEENDQENNVLSFDVSEQPERQG